jgi:hypothetical protein
MGMLAANALWFFFVKGTATDVRWIFHFLWINPYNAQIPVPPAMEGIKDTGLRFPLMLILFPKIASNFGEGLCLFMIILSIYLVNYLCIMMSGTYLYLEKYMENPGKAVIDSSVHESLLKLSYANNIACMLKIIILSITAAILFALFSLRLITLKTVISLFCFIVWLCIIFLAMPAARQFVRLYLYTSIMVLDHDACAKKALEKILRSRRKAIKLCTIGLFFVYTVIGILIYNYFA